MIPTRKRHSREKRNETTLTDEQRTRLIHEASDVEEAVDRIAGDVQRGKATKRHSGGVMDEGPQGGKTQKEGGAQAESQDPGGSECDG